MTALDTGQEFVLGIEDAAKTAERHGGRAEVEPEDLRRLLRCVEDLTREGEEQGEALASMESEIHKLRTAAQGIAGLATFAMD